MLRVTRLLSGRRSKWVVAGAWLLLIVGFAGFGSKLPDKTNDEIVLPASSQSAQVQKLLAERFPGGEQRIALLVFHRPGGFTARDRRDILSLGRIAATVPGVAGTIPPFGAARTSGLAAPDVAGTIVLLNAQGLFSLRPTIETLRERTEPSASGSGAMDVHVTGTPALLSDFNSAVKDADVSLLLATGLLVLLLLLAVYRSPLLALLPLTVVGVAYAVATGILYLLAAHGLPVDSTSTSLLLVLMFGAGTDYCLLLVARYRAALREGLDVAEAVAQATASAAPAMIASSATVILALVAMLAGVLGLNRTLGPVNAIGVAVVLTASLTLLPALLAILGRRAFWPRTERATAAEQAGEGIWSRFGERVRRRPATWLAALALALVGCSAGLLVYHEHANWLLQFRNATDSTQGYDVLRTRFPAGTLAPTTVLVERSNGPITPADVAAVRSRVTSVSGVQSVIDTGRRSRDGSMAALAATFTDDPYGHPAFQRVDRIRAQLRRLGPGLQAILGDGSAQQVDFKRASNRDFHVIVPLVLCVVLLTLIILLRALVAPLFLLATVVVSFVGSLGLSLLVFRYGFGQRLFDPELRLIIFIFLVALGADYNIFLMSRVREEAAVHGTDEGMLRALRETGPVITSAGLILAGTFSVLAVLPIYELFEIGFAVSLGVLIDTFIVRSIAVPAITWLLGETTWWPSRVAPQRTSQGS